LVTGADGYIGSVLSGTIQASFDLVAYDNGYYSQRLLYDPPWDPPTTIKGDIRDLRSEDLVGFDVVVCLSDLNDPTCERMPQAAQSINVDGNVHLARCARAAGVRRLIYSSSASVYGNSAATADESQPVQPLNRYARKKVETESRLLAMCDDTFDVVCLRNATVYGPSPRQRLDLIVNFAVAAAATGAPITLSSDGSAWRPFVHVDDVCAAIEVLLDQPLSERDRVLNIGSTAGNMQVRDAVHSVAAAVDAEVVLGSVADDRSYQLDTTRLSKLGIEFHRDLGEEVARLIDVFRRAALAEHDLTAGPFVRLRDLEYLQASGRLDHLLRWSGP
jgi:nucleoside-diphosphate-sugar epimerase